MARQRWRPTHRREQVTNPAVGVDWSRLNDSGGGWLIGYVVATLTTDANVANREPNIRATDGNLPWFRSPVQVAQTAGLTNFYCAFPGSDAGAATSAARLFGWPTDGLWLPPGHRLEMVTALLQAGDQWSDIHLDLWEYPETIPMGLIPQPFLYESADSE